MEVYRHLYIYIHVYTTSELGARLEQKKVGAEAGAAPVFALKWLAMQMHALTKSYTKHKKRRNGSRYNLRQGPTAAWQGRRRPQGKRKIWRSKKHKAKTVMIHAMAI